MYFNKIPPSCNFIYQQDDAKLLATESTSAQAKLEDLGSDVYRFEVQSGKWSQASQAELDTQAFADTASVSTGTFSSSGLLEFSLKDKPLLSSQPEQAFGVLGKKWVLGFNYDEAMRFYGLGEKNTGLEKSGHITKFWNTDTVADFGMLNVEHKPTDPFYVTIPYLIIQQPGGCIGILLNNPWPSFMNLAAKEQIANLAGAKDNERPSITIGAYGGTPEFYFILGQDMRAVTRKLMQLTGKTPLPPLWAIGYQQCRWGYIDMEDLEELDKKFDELDIPCDGLWLDIDYMDAYKVFTVNEAIESQGAERIKALQANGRRIVPIIDPGVKYLPSYAAFESGKAANAFCQTEEGNLYSGFVWPGRTAFPDFSLPQAREWWTQQVKAFTEAYPFDGYWLDMNDPSTGSAELEDMRFNNGQEVHETYHNQYAFGMQQATQEGVKRARPDKRPFLVSRSGYISSARHSAIWTGDNYSNYFHLREGINVTLNLGLSGIPFNGPDVPGFAGKPTPQLAVDWYKAGFLFPFLRNHSEKSTPRQEPWQFAQPYCDIIAHYIRLRYKLLPYLYQQFMTQAETGDPLLRPVFYDFPQDFKRFERVGDQFMVGPDIMQAPKVNEDEAERTVLLPTGGWYDAAQGRWLENDNAYTHKHTLEATPLLFRQGSMVPMRVGHQTRANSQLSDIELHIFKRCQDTDVSTLTYRIDDGESIDSPVSTVTLRAHCKDNTLVVEATDATLDFHPLTLRLYCYDAFESIIFRHGIREEQLSILPGHSHLSGDAIKCSCTRTVHVMENEPSTTIAAR